MQGMAVYPWRAALITGASSGLGRALAEALAAPGAALCLTGRDAARLAEAAAACRARGATVREALVDVRDAAAMEALIRGAGRLDLVIANAGVSAGTGGASEPADQARAIMAVNVTGMLNTAIPALEVMAAQEPGPDGLRGRVAVIASIAGFVAAPGAPAYCASKFAARAWAEAADGAARPRGLRVHAICPGYVRTPMTARNAFPMPLLMDAEDAARRTLDGIARGRVRIAYPRRLYAMARLIGALPPAWLSALMRLFPAKARGG
ncbi:SDR family NAD(P)-dependent oxidoreductase [Roseomonas hellenica]|uniref:SDR family NAD(P)-dependent oxidoreductase n=2 Tax=Plastoroseomonas hellenica TaxID=2687306 RepID=A0ABS5F7J6_9PROT|nr:SDR family NAD(P)-dependent oxidoreductase [Plastoroseomonas hellenica]MBR0668456.1 SDR family NAD(P)-dependent oxidoreductase [Plastoroseomonas hellenica]